MMRRLNPAKKIGGELRVPGDKSIAQRAALVSILSSGPITAKNFPDGLDSRTALSVAKQFGVEVVERDGAVVLTPPARTSILPEAIVDCGNSGTTARLVAGIAAGREISVIIAGDESLSRRPMKRVVDPLRAMGAEVIDSEGHLPMTVRGRKLLPFEYTLPVPSAQVKSSVLLAGLSAGCSVTIREMIPSRDHTELMLQHLQAGIQVREIKPIVQDDPTDPRKRVRVMPADHKREIILPSSARIDGGEIDIPGDFSTAAFFFTLAAISGGTVTVHGVGLNPSRTAFLDHLKHVGCGVSVSDRTVVSGEPRGAVTVTGGTLKPRRVAGDTVVGLIDEIPLVALIGAHAEGTTIIRDAAELRVKETDRLQAMADNLGLMGVSCGLLDDGLAIEGRTELGGADFGTYGDHRIAMAFAIASTVAVGPSTLDDDSCVAVSCPSFFELLGTVTS
ncbi:MAG: 3-phosphoshikimate 1-carboxyvinyltransferase [candidate division Zixibacteria bacterium]|jgi:3-phosphoshikimate 1-carboxyvinyltransferase|nr:3-phosphoshikimate 1-carboxyvinyltransferase [candidate division Zixibacteria bacterium]